MAFINPNNAFTIVAATTFYKLNKQFYSNHGLPKLIFAFPY